MRLSLPGPCPEAGPASVNPSLSDHGNELWRGARGSGSSGSSGGSLVAVWDGGAAAAAAAAQAFAPVLSAMQQGGSERELAARWEAEAVAAAEAQAAMKEARVGVEAGAAGEPEPAAGEEQPKAPERPHAAEEGDARTGPPALPLSKPKPAPARGLGPHGKPRGKGREPRPVTVDSSKARTSLEALKISIRQLKWKEVRPSPAVGPRGVDRTTRSAGQGCCELLIKA